MRTEQDRREIQVRAEIIHDTQHDPRPCTVDNCLLLQLLHQAVGAGFGLGWAAREILEGKAVVERDEAIKCGICALEAAEAALAPSQYSDDYNEGTHTFIQLALVVLRKTYGSVPATERIARLLNAEPEIVAALEAAERILSIDPPETPLTSHRHSARDETRAALAKVRP